MFRPSNTNYQACVHINVKHVIVLVVVYCALMSFCGRHCVKN